MDDVVLKAALALVLATGGSAYALGWRRLAAAGHARAAPTWRGVLYVAGLATLAAALLSPLDDLAAQLFSVHMIQHLLLTMVAAPLLLLGNPLPVALWGLPRRLRRAVARPLAGQGRLRRALRALTLLPVAWILYVSALWTWHLPVLYEAAVAHDLVHALEHVTFFGTSVLFWWPIIRPAPRLHRRTHPGFEILYLIAATAQNTLLGMALTLPERVLYPRYGVTAAARGVNPVDDQTFAGGLMWASGHMYLLPILLLLWALARSSASEGGTTPASTETRPAVK